MGRSTRGFTLIELLIVVVIIGILAAIAIPKFANTKEKAFFAAMKSDLRNLAVAQEGYFGEWNTFTTNKTGLNFRESSGVTATINVVAGPPIGWSATTSHVSTASSCAIFVSTPPVAPATIEGAPKCN